MSKEYRVYKMRGHDTFFAEDGVGWLCTHGNWYGEHTEVDGQPALAHVHGVSVYDDYEDLTEEQYKDYE